MTLDQCTGHLVDLNRSFSFDRFYPLGKPYFDLRLISLKELASCSRPDGQENVFFGLKDQLTVHQI